MSQTSVSNEPSRAFEGMVYDKAERTESALASELIYFGKGVSYKKDADLTQYPPIVQGYTSGEVLAGIAAADPTVERLTNPVTAVINAAPYGAYLANTSIRMIRRGRLWVKSMDAITDLTASVWLKNVDVAGTAATITDTTTYAVTDQDGLTSIITLAGYAAQTVLFAGSTVAAASVASQMNTQLVGCSVGVVGGQVVITTDLVGSTQTVAAAVGTGGLSWAAPVAGTGDVAISSDDARGTFRASTASGYTEFAAGAGLTWRRAEVIGGVNLGLLEVNLNI